VEIVPSGNALRRKRDGAVLEVSETALLVWQLCDGRLSVADIAGTLGEVYGIDPRVMHESIVPLLQILRDQSCLDLHQRVEDFTPPARPPYIAFHPIPADLGDLLDRYLEAIRPCFPVGIDTDGDTGLDAEGLARVIAQQVSRSITNRAWRDLNLVHIDGLQRIVRSIGLLLAEIVPGVNGALTNSGRALYGPGGSMGWHTNEDLPGRRIYCNWSENEGTNFFRYRDPDSGEIVTLYEPAGWSLKSFYVPPRPGQLWHCLKAGSRRVALGFVEPEFRTIDAIPVG